MTYVRYPFSLPVSILKLRSALQVAGAQLPSRIVKTGVFHIIRVYSATGSLVFESPELSEFSRLFRRLWVRSLEVPRPFKVMLTTIFYTGTVRGYSKSIRIKTSSTVTKNGVGLVPVPSDLQLRRMVSKNIRSVSRMVKPVRPRLTRSYASNLRPSPEVRNTNLSHLEISNDVLTGNTVTSYESYRREWTGTRTPNFGRLKRSQRPVNNHSMSEHRTLDLGIEISHIDFLSLNTPSPDCAISINSFSSAFGTGPAGVSPTFPPAHLALARNKAIKKLIDVCGSGLDANLAQDLTQFRQTARTISDVVSRIAGSAIALKKGNISRATNLLWHGKTPVYRKGKQPSESKSFANNWLAVQYGWKPLLMDIDGSMRALAEYYQTSPRVRTVRAAASTTKVEKFNLTHNTTGVKMGFEVRKTTTTSKFGMRYYRDDNLVSFLAQTGFTNPINLGWEVLPFSFVVDWFLPIGPYLETISSWDGMQFVDGFEVQFTRENTLKSLAYSGAPVFAHVNEQYYGGWQRESVRLDRNFLSGFPSMSFPELKSPIDAHGVHIANGLALLKGIFGK